jgi:nicotinamide-nucleotide amidase
VNAAKALGLLEAREWKLALAESLTGGLLADAFVQVPGASKALRGSVVAYATDVKHSVLGVEEDLLAQVGPVNPEVALAMAVGAANQLGADVALATTGVAGPDEQDGNPVGTVFIALVTPIGSDVRALQLSGDRASIRNQAVEEAVSMLEEFLTDNSQQSRA